MVLRPVDQSDKLCGLLADSGGEVESFPTLEIVPVETISTETLKDLIDWSERIIFISRNAVRILSAKMDGLVDVFNEKHVFATGSGTADEARSCGIKKIISPEGQSGSETLLSLADLQTATINEKKILIIRGDTGRELLKQELESRGAIVKYAEIYTRRMPEVSPQKVDKLWRQNPPDIIVITSNQGLSNLIDMTPTKYHKQLLSTDIVTMSMRIAQTAIKNGFIKKPVIAEFQTNQGLHDAVIKNLE